MNAMSKKGWTRRRLSPVWLVLVWGIGLTACSGDSGGQPAGAAEEIVEKVSSLSYDQTVSRIEAAVKGANLMIIGEPNYQAMQRMVGKQIRPAKAYFVFRPDLGIPVFETDYRAALEIPLKILVFEREDGKAVIRYYQPSSLLKKYGSGLDDMGRNLDRIIDQIATAATQ